MGVRVYTRATATPAQSLRAHMRMDALHTRTRECTVASLHARFMVANVLNFPYIKLPPKGVAQLYTIFRGTQFEPPKHTHTHTFIIVLFCSPFIRSAPPQRPRLEFDGVHVTPSQNISVDSKSLATVKCVSHYGNPPALLKWFLGKFPRIRHIGHANGM